MLVPVVSVRHMRMAVSQRLMPMRMAVRPRRHGVVSMVVMPVIVHMGMLVLQRLVLVFMAMVFDEMQDHACQHQRTAHGHAQRG